MHAIARIAIAAPVLFLAVAANAGTPGQPGRPPHPRPASKAGYACLSQKERKAANESGKIVHLATAIRSVKKRMPGAVVRARLCRGQDGLVYVLTVLARNGKVARLRVDAVKGTVVGKR